VSALLATLPLFPDVLAKLRQEQQQVGCADHQRIVLLRNPIRTSECRNSHQLPIQWRHLLPI
jgi:hypothetical protein